MKFIFLIEKKKDIWTFNNAFKYLIKSGVKLIFTVDCGTLSFDAIEFAKKIILM